MPPPLSQSPIAQNNLFGSTTSTGSTQNKKTFNSLFGIGGGSTSSPDVSDNFLFKKQAEQGSVPQVANKVVNPTAKRGLFDDDEDNEPQLFSKPKQSVLPKPVNQTAKQNLLDFDDEDEPQLFSKSLPKSKNELTNFFGDSLPAQNPSLSFNGPQPSLDLPPPPAFDLPPPPPLSQPSYASEASAPISHTSNQDLLDLDFAVQFEPENDEDFFGFKPNIKKPVPPPQLP